MTLTWPASAPSTVKLRLSHPPSRARPGSASLAKPSGSSSAVSPWTSRTACLKPVSGTYTAIPPGTPGAKYALRIDDAGRERFRQGVLAVPRGESHRRADMVAGADQARHHVRAD